MGVPRDFLVGFYVNLAATTNVRILPNKEIVKGAFIQAHHRLTSSPIVRT